MHRSDVSSIFGAKQIFRGGVASRMDLIELSSKGVTKEALLRLASYLRLSTSQMAQLLPVTDRTIQRRMRTQRFNRIVSEQILQIAELAARGTEIFGDKDRFLSWMKSPSVALGNRTPMSLLNSRFGMQMVLDELGRIEHGVVS